jgi:hypothetical protein
MWSDLCLAGPRLCAAKDVLSKLVNDVVSNAKPLCFVE